MSSKRERFTRHWKKLNEIRRDLPDAYKVNKQRMETKIENLQETLTKHQRVGLTSDFAIDSRAPIFFHRYLLLLEQIGKTLSRLPDGSALLQKLTLTIMDMQNKAKDL